MSQYTPAQPYDFGQDLASQISQYLSDPSNLPDTFKAWLLQYIETFPPSIPFTQVQGYQSATAVVRVATPGAVGTSGTASSIPWTSETFDVQNMHDNVTNNTRLTCKNPGTYLVTGWVDWGTNVTGVREVWLRKNGATTLAGQGISGLTAVAVTQLNQAADIINLALNDYVELMGYQTSGGSLTPTQGAFAALRVAP